MDVSNSHRGPSIDASYHVLVHLAKLFQSRRFLEIDQSETRIACGGHVCKWIGTKCAVFIENLPKNVLIPSRSINKYGCHRQFLFLIGRFLKILSSETALPNEPKLGRKREDF
jgi:hypothetical protein